MQPVDTSAQRRVCPSDHEDAEVKPTTDTPLTPGDVVRLRSGGPAMTVEAVAGDGDVRTVWLNTAGKVEYGAFPPAVLERCNPQEATK